MSFLRETVDLWEKQIQAAKESKQKHFGDTAEEAWKYVGDPFEQLYGDGRDGKHGGGDESFPQATPLTTARVNKSWEYVAVMTPHVLGHVPHRKVTPRVPHLPEELQALVMQTPGAEQSVQRRAMETQAARLLEWWLNYLAEETNLFAESRAALPEALIKGRGLHWHELVQTPRGVMPGSFYDSVDGLLIDSDVQRMNDAAFIVRKRSHAAWRLEEMYGTSANKLRAARTSASQKATNEVDFMVGVSGPESSKSDIVEYYEIYSRMGLGRQFRDAPRMSETQDANEAEITHNLLRAVESNPNIRLVIVPGMDAPLNLPERILTGPDAIEQIKSALAWPIPFHEDQFNPWPCSKLDFHEAHDNPWSISPVRAALPIQRFLDHAITFVMARVRRSCRALVVMRKDLSEQFKEGIETGVDFEMLEVDGQEYKLDDLVKMIEFSEVKGDLMNVISVGESIWEQLTGITPLLHGGAKRAMRSATEAQGMQAAASSRPDDYAQCAENWQSEIASKSAIASRIFVAPKTINALFREEELGENGPLTSLWTNFISTKDPVVAMSEWSYSVEAGSSRRKNKQKLVDDAAQLTQTLMPSYMQLAMAGAVEPVNALLDVLGDAMDMPLDKMKLTREMIPPPEPQKTKSKGA